MTSPGPPGWNIGPADRRALAAAIDNAAYHGLPPGSDTAALEALLGRDNLVAALAGTTDKTTLAWRNARDDLGRYRRGTRHPRADKQALMTRAAQAHRRQQIRGARKASFTFKATFTISSTTWKGKAHGDLTGPALTSFLDALTAGDHEAAARAAAEGPYFDPGLVTSVTDIEGFTLDWNLPGPLDTPHHDDNAPPWAQPPLW